MISWASSFWSWWLLVCARGRLRAFVAFIRFQWSRPPWFLFCPREADCVPREAILSYSLGIYEWVEDTEKWQSAEACTKTLSWWEPSPLSLAQLSSSLAVFSLLTVDREIIKCCSILQRQSFQQISVLKSLLVWGTFKLCKQNLPSPEYFSFYVFPLDCSKSEWEQHWTSDDLLLRYFNELCCKTPQRWF